MQCGVGCKVHVFACTFLYGAVSLTSFSSAGESRYDFTMTRCPTYRCKPIGTFDSRRPSVTSPQHPSDCCSVARDAARTRRTSQIIVRFEHEVLLEKLQHHTRYFVSIIMVNTRLKVRMSRH
jgi:hypothetical protein